MTKTWSALKEYVLCREFLSEPSEFHALWFGFFSSWFKLRREEMSKELNKQIEDEYHYYSAGFFVGRVVQGVLVLSGIDLVI